MRMPYTTNPRLPLVRMEAIKLLWQGWSARQVSRYLGYDHSTIVRWSKRKPVYGPRGVMVIPTISSKPNSHPNQLSEKIISRILEIRGERQQCAEIIHHKLIRESIVVSLSSVKRVLRRNGCSKYSKWKKWHQYSQRPLIESPGALVEIDSMMDGLSTDRLSAYALVDVCSRWAHASPIAQPNSRFSTLFIGKAQEVAPFKFQLVQSDHGSEFSKWFTKVIEHRGISHRHSRVRKPTDNGHVERFIQTLQKDCLNRVPKTMKSWQKEIPEFIRYYNYERPHMGLNYKTPMEVVRSY